MDGVAGNLGTPGPEVTDHCAWRPVGAGYHRPMSHGPTPAAARLATAAAVARPDRRRWWRTAVLVGVLGALVGGAVLALALGVRRTATAYPRLVAASSSADVRVDLFGEGEAAAPRLRARPEVASVVAASGAVGRRAGTRGWIQVTSVDDQRMLDAMVVVRGRPVPPGSRHGVVVTERTARVMGVDVGSRVPIDFYATSQFADVGRDYFVPPVGGRVVIRVVGITRDASDAQVESSAKVVTAGPDFVGTRPPRRAATVRFVRLRPGTDPVAFARAVTRIGGIDGSNVHVLGTAPASVRENRRTVTVGLVACAVVLALAGLLACGQAARRRLTRPGDEARTLLAPGTTRSERVLAAVLALGDAALVAGVGAVVVAAAASPLFPIGLLRDFEPHPGFAPNAALLALGGIGVAAALSPPSRSPRSWPSGRPRSRPPAGPVASPAGSADAACGPRSGWVWISRPRAARAAPPPRCAPPSSARCSRSPGSRPHSASARASSGS